MIEIYFKTIRDGEVKKISDYRAGCWVYAKDATVDDLQTIAEFSHLHIEDLRDSLDKQELPRIEHQEDNLFLFMRHPEEVERGLYTVTLTLVLTRSFVIAISPCHSEVIEHLVSTNPSTTQKSKLLLSILLKITQDYTASIKRVRAAILEQEQSLRGIGSQAIVLLTKNEEILNQYLIALVPMRNVLESMGSGRYLSLYEMDFDLLQDLMNAIKQSEDLCRVNVKSIRSLRDAYQILFTNDVNRTIKILTAMTIIFMIPTIVASFYGMNVAVPFQTSQYAFLGVVLFSLVVSVGAVVFFLRKRWL